jgi:hypothetical protein
MHPKFQVPKQHALIHTLLYFNKQFWSVASQLMVVQTGCYLVLRGVQGCFSLHIAIWLCCGCGHRYNREAIGVRSVLMIRPKCWQHRSKVNHLTVIAAWKCVLLDVICRNGSWALGTWVPWRLCVMTICMLQLASNNTCLATASHNTRHKLQRNYHIFWTTRHAIFMGVL